MSLFEIAIKNIVRRKIRSVLIISAMLLSVVSVVSMIVYSKHMTHNIKTQMDKFGANIIITPKSESLSLNYGGFSAGSLSYDQNLLKAGDVDKVREIKDSGNISAVAPFLMGPVFIEKRQTVLAGLNFNNVENLRPWWKINGKKPEKGEILLGARVAEILKKKAKDQVYIGKFRLTVSGVIDHSGSQDDNLVFVNLYDSQMILKKYGLVSFFEVAALCSACPIDEMVSQIKDKLPNADVKAIRQVIAGRMNSNSLYGTFIFSILFFLAVISFFAVMITMIGSVKERTQDIGIFMAVGFKSKHILSMIIIESVLLSVVAGVTGFIGGNLLTDFLLRYSSDLVVSFKDIDFSLFLKSLAVTVLAGVTASVYPAVKASRMDPVKALKCL